MELVKKGYWTGKKRSPETIAKMSANRKGISPWNKGISYRAGLPKPWKSDSQKGEKNFNWKGLSVQYRALHNWVENTLGKPTECSECGKFGSGRGMHWANISHEYKREISDWKRLCPACHKKFDTKLSVKEMAY